MTCRRAIGRRAAELARIHIAAKELGLDRDTYEDMLWTLCRVRSAADLDEHGRRLVLDHLRARGYRFRRPGSSKWPARDADRPNDDQVALIRHIWGRLAAAGVVRHSDEDGLRAFVQPQTRRYHPVGAGYSAPEFLPPPVAQSLIEHLKQWAARCRVEWR